MDGADQVLEAAGDFIGVCDQMSSVDDYSLFESHLARGNDDKDPPPGKVSGAPLRELQRFFIEKDSKRDFAGLKRVADKSTGAALWTMNEDKLVKGEMLMVNIEKSHNLNVEHYEELKKEVEGIKVQRDK